jgi:[acyl-carrier-protein] S-malonyltransferase
MGAALAESFAAARLVFEEVDDALGQKLSRLMREGPEAELTLTANAQPALMAVSLAVVRVLEQEGGFRLSERASCMAGHSLGEYSALAASGALALAESARLLRVRGAAMQEAVPVGEGAMAALLGLDLPAVNAVVDAVRAEMGRVCESANDNAPGQVVISGHKDAVERAIQLAQERGAKRAVLLPVSAPFHCTLMAPAARRMEEALAGAGIQAPAVPIIANITAQPVIDAAGIRALLVQQVTGTVRWRESVETMRHRGVTRVVELGAGKVLAGLVKRIDRDVETHSVHGPAEIEAVLKILG